MNHERPRQNKSASNKIATYIARAIFGLFGVGLFVLFVALKLWKTADFET